MKTGLCLVCLFAVACDNNAAKPFTLPDSGGQDGFVFTQNDLTLDDGPTLSGLDLQSDVDGPTITITEPAQAMPPTEVAHDTMTVTATVVGKNGAFIDSSSVQVLIPASTPTGFIAAPLGLTAMQDSYSGTIDISSVKPGPAEFTVVAADVNGKHSSAKGTYIHDHGPIITFIQPTQPTAKGSLYLLVQVDDKVHPITDASKVKATVRPGDNIALTAVAGSSPLRVQGTIKFSDYSPELDGAQLVTVTATNSNNTTGTAVKQFTVDKLGPTITFVNPVPGQFVGGVLDIKATIEDLSGVAEGTVVAVFGGDPTKSAPLSRVQPDKNDFQGLFDVRQLGTNYVLPSFSIRADDLLGNHSEVGEEIVIDNVPPRMSLDPPDVWVGTASGGEVECSQPFDPVGDDAASDGEKVPQIVTLRAQVEDRGNEALGLAVRRVSKVDHETVYLYGIPVGNGPLAVDTDGDGKCDDVNPLLVPTTVINASNQAIAVKLAPIPPSGSLDKRPSPFPAASLAGCDQVGTAVDPPPPLCLNVDGLELSYACSYTDDNEPAIWTLPPVAQTPSGCVGFQFDSLNMPDGPACFVVVARDLAGNHSVSAPLRLCLNRNGACNSGWPPVSLANCTGTYDKVTQMTSMTACTLPSPLPGGIRPK